MATNVGSATSFVSQGGDPDDLRLCHHRSMQAAFREAGAWIQPFAFRRTIMGMLNGFPLFYNFRKG